MDVLASRKGSGTKDAIVAEEEAVGEVVMLKLRIHRRESRVDLAAHERGVDGRGEHHHPLPPSRPRRSRRGLSEIDTSREHRVGQTLLSVPPIACLESTDRSVCATDRSVCAT